MQLKCQNGESRCMLYSLAMCLDMDVEDLAVAIGYDGFGPFYTNDEKRSHHPQEFMDIAMAYGYALIEVEPNPYMGHPETYQTEPIWTVEHNAVRMQGYLNQYDGLLHIRNPNGALHMCAWCKDEQMVYDPNGHKYRLTDDVGVIAFYALVPLK